MRFFRSSSGSTTIRSLLAALVVVAFVLGLVAGGMGAPERSAAGAALSGYGLSENAPSLNASSGNGHADGHALARAVHHESHGCCDGDRDAEAAGRCALDCAAASCAPLALTASPGAFALRDRALFVPSRSALRLDGGPQVDTPPPKHPV